MPLKGIKVLEFCGLAPGPFCGKILADFGATVTRIDKIPNNFGDVLQNGKRSLALNLKDVRAQNLVKQLSAKYDVIIEPFRPGIMEKLNLGPEVICKQNPRLIYARLTGFGQNGPLANRAGHDINYLAISGVLSMLGRHNDKPLAPINFAADFAGGGLMCALGICLALLERHNSGKGQVVDAAMVDGAAYIASWLFQSRWMPIWSKERGRNFLDGGSFFYDTYKTKDGKFMSVGALEPQFFEVFKQKLDESSLKQSVDNEEDENASKLIVEKAFLKKTQAEWSIIFEDFDACVYPVVEWTDVMNHRQNRERNSFEIIENMIVPQPAPKLSRTPGEIKKTLQDPLQDAAIILQELNLNKDDFQELINDKVIVLPKHQANL